MRTPRFSRLLALVGSGLLGGSLLLALLVPASAGAIGPQNLTPEIPPPPTAVPTEVPATPVPPTPEPERHARPTPTPAPEIPTPEPPTATLAPYRTNVKLVKTASQTEATIGDLLTYTLTASNTGPVTAYDVVVTDQIPVGLTVTDLRSQQGTMVVRGQTVTVYIDTLAAGQVVTAQIVVRIGAADPVVIANTGHITTTTDGDDPSDNTSTVIVSRTPPRLPRTDAPPPTALETVPTWVPWLLVGSLLMALGSAMTVAIWRRRRDPSIVVGTTLRPIRTAAPAATLPVRLLPLGPPQLGALLPVASAPAPLPPLVPLDRDAALRDALPDEES